MKCTFIQAAVCVLTPVLFSGYPVQAQPIPAGSGLSETSITKITPLEKKERKTTTGPPAIRMRYLYIERPRAKASLSYEINDEQVTSKAEKRDDTVGEFREGVGFSTRGWLYHPALLSFDLDFAPEWIQATRDNEYSGDGYSDSYLSSYYLRADLLPLKPYTLNVFGKKHQNSFRNTFSERALVNTDSYGSTLAFKYRALPTTLSYANSRTERKGTLVSQIDQDQFNLGMSRQRAGSSTRLNAYYNDSLQENEGEENRIKSSRSHLMQSYFFNKDLIKRLNSNLIYDWSENTGDNGNSFSNSSLRWTEHLYWTHRKNLWTNYRLLFQNQATDDSRINTGGANVSLSHLLYENLTTEIDGGIRRDDFADGFEDSYLADLKFRYTRGIPWGTLNLNTGLGADYTKKDSGGDWIWEIDEGYKVTAGGVNYLQHENVDPGSIRVTSTTGSILYIENQDYTVEASGTLVRVRPTLYGNIKDGQQLLISYRYSNEGTYDDVLYSRSAGINVMLWSTLRLSYDYYRRTQDVISGLNTNTPVDETVHRTQARLMWWWTDTTISYDVYDTLLDSARNSWRLSEELTFRPVREVELKFSGNLGSTSFTRIDEEEDFYRYAARLSWRPAFWCSTGLETYRYELSGNSQNEANKGLLGFVDLFYGQWTLNLSYRLLEDAYEERDYERVRQGIMLRISRMFW